MRCTKCLQEKDIHDFAFNKSRGRPDAACRECKQQHAKAYAERKEVKARRQSEEYRKANRDHKREKYANDAEFRLILSERMREYRNRPESKAKKRADEQLKRQTDPQYRMASNLRRRLSSALAKVGGIKSTKSVELWGCSPVELKQHIESLWLPGMSWDNYGLHGWHIDHILPVVSFNLMDPDQQRKCCHYTNLRPLWAIDNLRKGSKIMLSDGDHGKANEATSPQMPANTQ